MSLVHAKIDSKEGDSVRVHWGKAATKKGGKRPKIPHDVRHDATVVEIDWAKGTKSMQVEFGGGEAAWMTASCVEKSTKPN